ncbi:MAG: type II secretion system GspH family protein [Thalassotalea sp.]|nr:type II secretion system GspH family protein [Thalassotalea sp.]
MRSSFLQASFSRANKKAKGFTLLELVIGIVVLAISFSVITSFIVPQSEQSANQIHQIRAAELGQSLMNEILAKAFDEQSDLVGGAVRCGETGLNACTISSSFGPDGAETRASFDDVDDYHNLNESGDNIQGVSGDNSLVGLYSGYRVQVAVAYDDTFNGSDTGSLVKRIDITVTTPSGETVQFATYKANF